MAQLLPGAGRTCSTGALGNSVGDAGTLGPVLGLTRPWGAEYGPQTRELPSGNGEPGGSGTAELGMGVTAHSGDTEM